MDPLSITTAVLALAGAVYKGAAEIRRITGTLNDAPESLSDLAEEVLLIQGALRGVEAALLEDSNAIVRFEIDDVFSIAIKGSRATLECINKEFDLLFSRSDWTARFLLLWKEEDMAKLLDRLDRKRGSILLLIQLLSLRSVWEVRLHVVQNRHYLNVAKQDIVDLIPSYPGCRRTILDSLDNETVDSMFGDRESFLSTTEFDFDLELINTRAYRRALAKATRGRPRQKVDRGGHLSESPGGSRSRSLSRVGEAEEEDAQPFEDLIDLSWEPETRPTSTPQAISKGCTDLEGLSFPTVGIAGEQIEVARSESPGPSDSPTADLSGPLTLVEKAKLSEPSDEAASLPDRNKDGKKDLPTDWDRFGLPEDGKPVTIRTRGHRRKSQTSLLIEYFEGGKALSQEQSRRPSVRVRLTPGSKTKGDHIQAFESATKSFPKVRREGSATVPAEVPIIIRHFPDPRLSPIEVEVVDESQYLHDLQTNSIRRSRASGAGKSHSPFARGHRVKEESPPLPRDSGLLRATRHLARNVKPTIEPEGKEDRGRNRKPKAKKARYGPTDRSSSTEATHGLTDVEKTVPQRSPFPKNSINNPKLLETVEDAIRTLILPELTVLKKDQERRKMSRSRPPFDDLDDKEDLHHQKKEDNKETEEARCSGDDG